MSVVLTPWIPGYRFAHPGYACLDIGGRQMPTTSWRDFAAYTFFILPGLLALVTAMSFQLIKPEGWPGKILVGGFLLLVYVVGISLLYFLQQQKISLQNGSTAPFVIKSDDWIIV